MRVHKDHFERLRRALAAGVVAVLAAAPALAADAAPPAASRYVPTMADYLGVYDALQHYRFGVEKHDQKMEESAFWEDGVNIAVPSPGQEIRMPLKEGGSPQPLSGPPGPNGGPPPGFAPPPGGTAADRRRVPMPATAGLAVATGPAAVVAAARSGTYRWTATSTSTVRPAPRTTNISSAFIRSRKRSARKVPRGTCKTAELRSSAGRATTKTSWRSAMASGGSCSASR